MVPSQARCRPANDQGREQVIRMRSVRNRSELWLGTPRTGGIDMPLKSATGGGGGTEVGFVSDGQQTDGTNSART